VHTTIWVVIRPNYLDELFLKGFVHADKNKGG